MSNDHNPTEPQSGEQAIAEKRQREKSERTEELQDIRWLMHQRRGRRIVHRLLVQLGVFQSSFNTNALTMAFNEGRRNEGLKFLELVMTSSPADYSTMMQEQRSDD